MDARDHLGGLQAGRPATGARGGQARTGLIILNLTVATEFPWALFPLVGWGIGLTLHYLFGLRWVNKAISDRQARIEQRATATNRAA